MQGAVPLWSCAPGLRVPQRACDITRLVTWRWDPSPHLIFFLSVSSRGDEHGHGDLHLLEIVRDAAAAARVAVVLTHPPSRVLAPPFTSCFIVMG